MGRLIDIDSLKGCAIIRPTSHESIEHIKQCGNDVLNHNDIPTAYDVDAVIQLVMTDICNLPLPKEELDNLRDNLISSIKDGGIV